MGWMYTAMARMHSASTYMTVASLGLPSSLLHSTQGWVRSMYLLHSPISFQISDSATENCSLFICSSTMPGSASNRSFSGMSGPS